MINRFILNEVSYFGPGAREVLPQEIKRLGLNKAFVTTDKDLLKFGVADKVGAVGNHETGNIHRGRCGVPNLHIVQILTVGGDISAVARKNFTDNHRLGADIVAAALTVKDHCERDSSSKQNDAGK